jgi:hypothetical protein
MTASSSFGGPASRRISSGPPSPRPTSVSITWMSWPFCIVEEL